MSRNGASFVCIRARWFCMAGHGFMVSPDRVVVCPAPNKKAPRLDGVRASNISVLSVIAWYFQNVMPD